MSYDLEAANRGAHNLARLALAIRALIDEGESEALVARLEAELHAEYDGASAAIRAAAELLRQTRGCVPFRQGDIVAPTAHEAAIEIVYALNRQRHGVSVNGQTFFINTPGSRPVKVWPDLDELLATIDLESSNARALLAQRQRAVSGPVDGARFRWGRQEAKDLTKLEYALAGILWADGECPALSFEEVARRLYREKPPRDDAVRAMLQHYGNLRDKMEGAKLGIVPVRDNDNLQLRPVDSARKN